MKLNKQGIILASLFALAAGTAGEAQAAQRKCYTSEIKNRPSAEVAIDATTGHVLSGVNENMSIYQASLTKRMTLLLVLDAIKDRRLAVTDEYGKPVRISLPMAKFRNADNGTQDFDPISFDYTSISLYDAIKAMILRSSNRAPLALAIAVAGSEEKFVTMMNAKAKELGLVHTHFVNATGYPTKESLEHHRTTVREHAEIVRVLFRDYPEEMKKLRLAKAQLTGYRANGSAGRFLVGTTLHLMQGLKFQNILGGKTGTACVTAMLDAEAEIDGRNVISVVAGNDRNKRAYQLLIEPGQEILAKLEESRALEIVQDMVRQKDTLKEVAFAKLVSLEQKFAAAQRPITLLKAFPLSKDQEPGRPDSEDKPVWIRERDSEIDPPFPMHP